MTVFVRHPESFSQDWAEAERRYPDFGPDITFPSTPTGQFLQNHLKRRSTTSDNLFYFASTLVVSATRVWRRICPQDLQPMILQCDPVLLLALRDKLISEHPGLMERFERQMKDWKKPRNQERIQRGDVDMLVCFWVLFHLRYPKATGRPFRLE